MGLASSQARLLSITARLTSNEYESQQISNAKMRLATQTQEASEAYIAALNDIQYSFISFDSTGDSVKTPLTVALTLHLLPAGHFPSATLDTAVNRDGVTL